MVTAGAVTGSVRLPDPGSTVTVCEDAPRSFQAPKAYVEPSLGLRVCGSGGTAMVWVEFSAQLKVCGVVGKVWVSTMTGSPGGLVVTVTCEGTRPYRRLMPSRSPEE